MKEQLKRRIEHCVTNDLDDDLTVLSNEIHVFSEMIENKDILNLAVKYNSVDVVKLLLSMGADARADNSQLLCQSVADDQYDIARLLVQYGADVSTDDNDPLRLALNTYNHRMFLLLIKKVADLKYALDSALKDYTAYGANNGLSWNVQ